VRKHYTVVRVKHRALRTVPAASLAACGRFDDALEL